jgi:hypothetical protein
MLFDKKTTDLSELKKFMKEAAVKKWGEGKIPADLINPIQDGDLPKFAKWKGFAGNWAVNCSQTVEGIENSKIGPEATYQVFDTNKAILLQGTKLLGDKSKIYSGCFGAAVLSVWPYDTKGKKGLTFYIKMFMKTSDGEKLISSMGAEDAFGDIEGQEMQASNNPENYTTPASSKSDDMFN